MISPAALAVLPFPDSTEKSQNRTDVNDFVSSPLWVNLAMLSKEIVIIIVQDPVLPFLQSLNDFTLNLMPRVHYLRVCNRQYLPLDGVCHFLRHKLTNTQ